MNTVSMIAMHSVSASTDDDQSFRAITLMSCCGLALSLCLVALGVDLGGAWL